MIAFVALLLPCLPAADVFHVPGDVASVQAAIDLAADGDIVLVSPAAARAQVQIAGKGLTLVGDGGLADFHRIDVVGTPAGSTVVLRGLEVLPQSTCVFGNCSPGPGDAVVVTGALGEVRIEACNLFGQDGRNGGAPVDGKAALVVTNSSSVVVDDSLLEGGQGADLSDERIDQVGSGGRAISVTASTLWVLHCDVQGGHSGFVDDTTSVSGDGGPGIVNVSGEVLLSDSQVSGGGGGNSDCTFFSCGSGGDGGDAYRQSGSAPHLWLRASGLRPGDGGPGGFGGAGGASPGPPGSPGQSLDLASGTLTLLTGRAADLAASSPVRSGDATTITVTGMPQATVWLLASLQADSLLVPDLGWHVLVHPVGLQSLPLGATQADGTLSTNLTLPTLPAGVEGLDLHLQALIAGSPLSSLSDTSVLSWVSPGP